MIDPRKWWWCSLCGARTSNPPSDGRYARCPAHAGLPNERDLTPPDPATMITTMAQLHVLEMWGADGDEPLHRMTPPSGEDSQATRETGA